MLVLGFRTVSVDIYQKNNTVKNNHVLVFVQYLLIFILLFSIHDSCPPLVFVQYLLIFILHKMEKLEYLENSFRTVSVDIYLLLVVLLVILQARFRTVSVDIYLSRSVISLSLSIRFRTVSVDIYLEVEQVEVEQVEVFSYSIC